MKRHSIETITKFVNENSDCKLISKEYKNVDSKLEFECKCGNHFETTFYKFSKRNKRQCNSCGYKDLANKNKLSYEEVKQFIEVDSNSGCTLLSDSYDNAQEKLKILCHCGNEFEVKFNHFKSSFQRQCPECGHEQVASQRRLSKTYVNEVISSKGCKLLSDYKNINTPIKIQCKCGNTFTTLFPVFRDYDVQSCAICREKEKSTSKGESKIEQWLIDNEIAYETQYKFDDLKHEKPLKFDFAILNKHKDVKMLIEYDGKQHFGVGLFSSDEKEMLNAYNIVKQSDFTKNEYCFKKGIPLLRIPYNCYYKIDTILENSLL